MHISSFNSLMLQWYLVNVEPSSLQKKMVSEKDGYYFDTAIPDTLF